jgi:hypothetical protein
LKIGKSGKHVKSMDTKLVSINFTVHLMLRYVSMTHFRNPQISSRVGGVSNCPQLLQFELIFWWLVFIILWIFLGEELGKTWFSVYNYFVKKLKFFFFSVNLDFLRKIVPLFQECKN